MFVFSNILLQIAYKCFYNVAICKECRRKLAEEGSKPDEVVRIEEDVMPEDRGTSIGPEPKLTTLSSSDNEVRLTLVKRHKQENSLK